MIFGRERRLVILNLQKEGYILFWLVVWQLQPAERKLYFLALVVPPLLPADVAFLRYIRR